MSTKVISKGSIRAAAKVCLIISEASENQGMKAMAALFSDPDFVSKVAVIIDHEFEDEQ